MFFPNMIFLDFPSYHKYQWLPSISKIKYFLGPVLICAIIFFRPQPGGGKMSFAMEKFIHDIFAPISGEVFTMMTDIPHHHIEDTDAWKERREMAEEWLEKINKIAGKWDMKVNPLVAYPATGGDNAGLPESCEIGGKAGSMKKIIEGSSIIISMLEYSGAIYWFRFSTGPRAPKSGFPPAIPVFSI
jgi:hypothetical protein